MGNIAIKIINFLLVIISIFYPIIFLSLDISSELYYISYVMAGLWIIRGYFQFINWQRYISILIGITLLLISFFYNTNTMYWYPVLVNLILFFVFSISLFGKQTIIEKIARLKDPSLPDKAIKYTRRVTQVWCLFFIINIIISSSLIINENFEWWALYTGILAYVFMGLLMVFEKLVRQRMIANNG